MAWYPLHVTAEERRVWRPIPQGEGIHWPDVDEDIGVSSLIAGRPSSESAVSLQRWLAGRSA
jgi:hypothetical protein